MILVFIILGIIILINLIIVILVLSNLRLEIKTLHISNTDEKFSIEFILDSSIYLLNKFKIFKILIDNDKINNLIKSGKINIKKIKYNKDMNKNILKVAKYLNIEIEYFKLEGYFATFNTILSCVLNTVINSIIPILIAPNLNGEYINNIKFINVNQNIININLNCIINVKIVNIINILHYLKKKGGKENNGKSSYRRSYAYSNE